MPEDNLHSVLRCRLCNKPFDKQSTLKRHGYYCRSRRTGTTPRTRSCISCVKGKARCDNRRPECSRCQGKAIQCHYPAKTPERIQPRTQNSSQLTEKEQSLVAESLPHQYAAVEHDLEGSSEGGSFINSTLTIADPGFVDIEWDFVNWADPDFNLPGLLSPHTDPQRLEHLTPRPLFSYINGLAVQEQQVISYRNVSIPAVPTSDFRSLIQRPKVAAGPQRIANLILHTFKSYPLMIMRDKTLPPFIHPRLTSSEDEDHTESLNNCISLMHMIRSGVQGSRKLFWKNVRMECERLCAEYLSLERLDLLAAMQALSIYIFVRLDEGDTDHNNLDSLLVKTVIILSQQFAGSPIPSTIQSESPDRSLKTRWQEWVFEESRRRLCVVYGVMNMLVYFEPSSMCEHQPDLLLAPLPANKQLWEASDEFAWRAEFNREPKEQTAFGLAASGELVRLNKDQLNCAQDGAIYEPFDSKTQDTDKWEDWCSGMDGLGGLVMLAACLTGT